MSARARRRRSYFDREATIACYIASRSDIDDILPTLTAFQIEWNKLHRRMQGSQVRDFLRKPADGAEGLSVLAHGTGIDADDLDRLRLVWGEAFWPTLRAMADGQKRFRVRLLAGSLSDYQRATQEWWEASKRPSLHREKARLLRLQQYPQPGEPVYRLRPPP